MKTAAATQITEAAATAAAAALVVREALRSAAADAAAEWVGWTWAHDPAGPVVTGPGAVDDWAMWETERVVELVGVEVEDEDGRVSPLSVDEAGAMASAERTYGEGCQQAAAGAADLGREAVEAAESGDLREALRLAQRAAGMESDYGDSPAYSGLVSAIEQAIAAEEEEEEEREL